MQFHKKAPHLFVKSNPVKISRFSKILNIFPNVNQIFPNNSLAQMFVLPSNVHPSNV